MTAAEIAAALEAINAGKLDELYEKIYREMKERKDAIQKN